MHAGRRGKRLVPPMPGHSARIDGRGSGAGKLEKDRLGFHRPRNSQISLGFVKPEYFFVRWRSDATGPAQPLRRPRRRP